MELIPILSLIILVATISTFMLAVGAYILYKIRERKGVSAPAAQPAALPAELITPAPMVSEQRAFAPDRRTFDPSVSQTEYGYDYQRQQSYVPQEEPKGPELRPTFVGPSASSYQETRYQQPIAETPKAFEPEKTQGKKKFVRYTNEGYVEPTRPEKKQEDNLRWR